MRRRRASVTVVSAPSRRRTAPASGPRVVVVTLPKHHVPAGGLLTHQSKPRGRRFGGRPRILFVGGALNQTRIAHAVARHLTDRYDCWFSPCYVDSGLLRQLTRARLLEWTALGGVMRRSSLEFLRDRGVQIDDGATLSPYDLVVATTDLIIPRNLRGTPMVLLQEGMTDPENLTYHIVKKLRLPRYLASTASFGTSGRFAYLCTASDGYKDLFRQKGVNPARTIVTGLPNWDDLSSTVPDPSLAGEPFVLVATSDARETFKVDRRKRFLRRCIDIAAGRKLVVKLHPNEHVARATAEIHAVAPDAVVRADGDVNAMVAASETLVTQYSTVVYVGMALGKECYSYFDAELLRAQLPLQTGGRSAELMASVCEAVLRPGRRNLLDVCQCRDCRSGTDRFHASAG